MKIFLLYSEVTFRAVTLNDSLMVLHKVGYSLIPAIELVFVIDYHYCVLYFHTGLYCSSRKWVVEAGLLIL